MLYETPRLRSYSYNNKILQLQGFRVNISGFDKNTELFIKHRTIEYSKSLDITLGDLIKLKGEIAVFDNGVIAFYTFDENNIMHLSLLLPFSFWRENGNDVDYSLVLYDSKLNKSETFYFYWTDYFKVEYGLHIIDCGDLDGEQLSFLIKYTDNYYWVFSTYSKNDKVMYFIDYLNCLITYLSNRYHPISDLFEYRLNYFYKLAVDTNFVFSTDIMNTCENYNYKSVFLELDNELKNTPLRLKHFNF